MGSASLVSFLAVKTIITLLHVMTITTLYTFGCDDHNVYINFGRDDQHHIVYIWPLPHCMLYGCDDHYHIACFDHSPYQGTIRH